MEGQTEPVAGPGTHPAGVDFCRRRRGALLGMRVFHHKTRKTKFRLGVPAALLLWVLLLGVLAVRMGMLPF